MRARLTVSVSCGRCYRVCFNASAEKPACAVTGVPLHCAVWVARKTSVIQKFQNDSLV